MFLALFYCNFWQESSCLFGSSLRVELDPDPVCSDVPVHEVVPILKMAQNRDGHIEPGQLFSAHRAEPSVFQSARNKRYDILCNQIWNSSNLYMAQNWNWHIEPGQLFLANRAEPSVFLSVGNKPYDILCDQIWNSLSLYRAQNWNGHIEPGQLFLANKAEPSVFQSAGKENMRHFMWPDIWYSSYPQSGAESKRTHWAGSTLLGSQG